MLRVSEKRREGKGRRGEIGKEIERLGKEWRERVRQRKGKRRK